MYLKVPSLRTRPETISIRLLLRAISLRAILRIISPQANHKPSVRKLQTHPRIYNNRSSFKQTSNKLATLRIHTRSHHRCRKHQIPKAISNPILPLSLSALLNLTNPQLHCSQPAILSQRPFPLLSPAKTCQRASQHKMSLGSTKAKDKVLHNS
jgi:hypothetical protein